jgi:hypothetical protein
LTDWLGCIGLPEAQRLLPAVSRASASSLLRLGFAGAAGGRLPGDVDGGVDRGFAGEALGECDGLADGERDGDVDGDGLGEADGDGLGEADGDGDGEALGSGDGDVLGDPDGESEGDAAMAPDTFGEASPDGAATRLLGVPARPQAASPVAAAARPASPSKWRRFIVSGMAVPNPVTRELFALMRA